MMSDIAKPNSAHHLTHPKYRADIDGLRAIAILSVVGFHAFPVWVKGGFIGVDIFFVISGYLISTIIFDSLERNSFSFTEFYSRRIKRIFPVLLVVLVSSYAFGWFALLADEYRQLGKHIAGGAGFVSNFILWSESGYFDNTAGTKPLLHLWSLGIEEQFYIIWPLLLALVWKRKWSFVAITATIAVVSFAFNIYMMNKDPAAAFYLPAPRFWELMTGGLLAYITLHKPHLNERCKNAQSIMGAILLALGLLLVNKDRAFPGWWALLPTLGAFLMISAGQNAWLNKHALSNRLLVWVGLISYPLYLWHWPLLSFARIIESEFPSREIRIAIVLLSIALAWLTYRLVEIPLRFGKYGTAKTIALMALMAVVGLVGYGTFKRDGLEFRSAAQTSSLNQRIADQFAGSMWKYTQNDLCLKRYPFAESAEYGWWFCMASKDAPPTLLLLGNSYANQLYPGFASNDKLDHPSILSIGACDPARVHDALPRDELANSPCSGDRELHQQRFIDNIIETSNSLRYAILDGLVMNPDDAYISRLKERIDFLENHHIKVIIFTPHLRVDYDIKGCYSRPFNAKHRSCELDLRSRQKLTENFSPLVRQISKSNPKVAFFDQNDLFCNNVKCSMLRNGMPLFRDEYHHISEYGSIELSKLFTKWAAKNIPGILIGP
ncbi:MAG: acyltransferase family protein [Gallionella sp.]